MEISPSKSVGRQGGARHTRSLPLISEHDLVGRTSLPLSNTRSKNEIGSTFPRTLYRACFPHEVSDVFVTDVVEIFTRLARARRHPHISTSSKANFLRRRDRLAIVAHETRPTMFSNRSDLARVHGLRSLGIVKPSVPPDACCCRCRLRFFEN